MRGPDSEIIKVGACCARPEYRPMKWECFSSRSGNANRWSKITTQCKQSSRTDRILPGLHFRLSSINVFSLIKKEWRDGILCLRSIYWSRWINACVEKELYLPLFVRARESHENDYLQQRKIRCSKMNFAKIFSDITSSNFKQQNVIAQAKIPHTCT